MVAITTYPTNAADAYQDRWAAMHARKGDSGVYFSYGNRFSVTIDTGLGITVASGACAIQGIDGVKDTTTSLTLATAHATLPRNDYIVASLHKDDPDEQGDPYSIELEVITGTPSGSSPLPLPALRNSSTRVDIPIAYVYVGPTVSSLSSGDVHMYRQWHPLESTPATNYSPTVVALDSNGTGSNWIGPQINASSDAIARYSIQGGVCHVAVKQLVELTVGSGFEYGFSLPVRADNSTVGQAIVQNVGGFCLPVPTSYVIGGAENNQLNYVALRKYNVANLTRPSAATLDQFHIAYEVARDL